MPCQRSRLRRLLDVVGIADIADEDVVGIVPAPRPRVLGVLGVLEPDRVEAGKPLVLLQAEVSRGPPGVPADLGAPLPDLAHPVLAEVEDDVARLLLEDAAHQAVGSLPARHLGIGPRARRFAVGAPVVLEEVEAPLREAGRVLCLVLPGPVKARARERARRRVDARFQPQAMDVVGQRLHVGEAAVGVDHAAFVPRRNLLVRILGPRPAHPRIVDVHVLVTMIRHARLDHDVGRLAHQGVARLLVEGVPVVPAHRRGERQRVADDDPERPLCASSGVGCDHGRLVRARGLVGNRAADDAGCGVEGQAFRETLDAERHRAVTGRGNAIQEWVPGPDAVDRRSVDAGLARRGRRQDARVVVGLRGGRRQCLACGRRLCVSRPRRGGNRDAEKEREEESGGMRMNARSAFHVGGILHGGAGSGGARPGTDAHRRWPRRTSAA